MNFMQRRQFLGTSLGGLTGVWASSRFAFADEPASVAPYAPDTLFLTWQQDPTTTMTVQWVGPETSVDTTIHYAPKDSTVWLMGKTITKPYPNTNLVVFRCELTGLDQGAEYQFQIGMNSPTYRFRTMPAKATNTIQFVSGGDCGVDEHAMGTNILAAKQEPHFALIGGDLAYDNGKDPQTFTKYLQNYHKQMVDPKGRLIPMVTIIGNHEVDGGYKTKRINSPQYLSLFDGLFPNVTYGTLDIGDYLSLVLLDTDHIEPIGGAQTDWLAQALKERQSRPHLIVANHVPAYPSYRPFGSENGKPGTGEEQRKHWCPLFERYNVDLVLEHHDHTFKRTHPLINGLKDDRGVLYLGDGSWGKLRVPKTPEERPYLASVSSAYHMTVHRLEGKERFHVAVEESGKVADVCRTVNKRAAL